LDERQYADPAQEVLVSASLSGERYDAALDFVRESGRPLDVALLEHGLGEGTAEAALVALSEFQNPDGGFGHGLEPDMQGSASTAIATSVALRLLLRLDAPARHPMVAAAMGWLGETLDREQGVWWIVGSDVNDEPHAPWWTWSADAIGSDSLAGAQSGFVFNPSAELLGQLYAYREAAPSDAIAIAEARLRREIAEREVIDSAYDLKCAIRLAETPDAPADLVAPLDRLIRRSLAAHADDEHGSAAEFAPTPASRFADVVGPRIGAALDALVAGQDADGGWPLFWDWSFVDAKAWAKCKRDSRGWVTRESLETLRAHGRVEGL
jgi:hypothetical protein